jgi:hypothetical protein
MLFLRKIRAKSNHPVKSALPLYFSKQQPKEVILLQIILNDRWEFFSKAVCLLVWH